MSQPVKWIWKLFLFVRWPVCLIVSGFAIAEFSINYHVGFSHIVFPIFLCLGLVFFVLKLFLLLSKKWRIISFVITSTLLSLLSFGDPASSYYIYWWQDEVLGQSREMPEGYTGVWFFYHSDGEKDVRHYVNGVEEGDHKWFYKDGTLKGERLIVNGQVQGVQKEYFQNGQIRVANTWGRGFTIFWHENGRLDYAGDSNKDGFHQGVWKDWKNSGSIVDIRLWDGKKYKREGYERADHSIVIYDPLKNIDLRPNYKKEIAQFEKELALWEKEHKE